MFYLISRSLAAAFQIFWLVSGIFSNEEKLNNINKIFLKNGIFLNFQNIEQLKFFSIAEFADFRPQDIVQQFQSLFLLLASVRWFSPVSSHVAGKSS